jgi:hypothetical protein
MVSRPGPAHSQYASAGIPLKSNWAGRCLAVPKIKQAISYCGLCGDERNSVDKPMRRSQNSTINIEPERLGIGYWPRSCRGKDRGGFGQVC